MQDWDGRLCLEDDGTVARVGDMVEVGALLVDSGYELVGVRRLEARD
jgi:hypothetical protein